MRISDWSSDVCSSDLPCAIMEDGDDASALEASLIENIARLDPAEVSQWETFTRLVQKDGRTPEPLGQTCGLTAPYVRRLLGLANLVPPTRQPHCQAEINETPTRH